MKVLIEIENSPMSCAAAVQMCAMFDSDAVCDIDLMTDTILKGGAFWAEALWLRKDDFEVSEEVRILAIDKFQRLVDALRELDDTIS